LINCLIVEDEPLAREVLERYIADHPDLELVAMAKDGFEGGEMLQKHPIDLLFLDINMPKISGINFYKSLTNKPPVIFTTAYPEFAVDGFDVAAVDYLVKPFSFERFVQAINKFKTANGDLEEQMTHLAVKTDKKMYRIPIDDISYIESIGNYVKIHTLDRVLISNETLKVLHQKLKRSGFQRIHKSYLINVKHVEFLEGNQVKIADQKLPVGYSYREEVNNFFRK
jgi:DNA-binding LytR/AlgR family response regulator